ncbi:MAG: hypothetical protein HUJ22_01050 [Gracilimonas sp.]|uniref:DUF5683 domain-containing protein n=1 Tax=Gracilimonas sp. TaxID=1974203 RepID=UPI001987677C|nr:DUF5683 domain-containing protein [Gracilimonas sp.]MBD3615128.1 hypothetical protein [Gracilimonas sp.]
MCKTYDLYFSVGFCIIVLLFLFGTNEANAQQNGPDPDSSYVNISSNFDSLYVLFIQDSTFIKAGKNDLLRVEPVEQQIILIPKYAPTISFDNIFEADSIYVVNVQFGLILDEVNPAYKRIESKDGDIGNITPSSLGIGFMDIRTYNRQQFANRHKIEEIDYMSTYLKVNTNTDSFYVQSSNNRNGILRIASGDSILYQPGNRLIRISHPYSKEWSTRKTIEEGKTTVIEHNFDLMEPSIETLSANIATKPHYGSNLFIVSDDDSEIIIDGEEIGSGAVKLNYRTGPVHVSINNSKTGKHAFTDKITNISSEKAVVINAYTKPLRSYSRMYGVFPGASQWYKRQKLKSALISGGFLVLGGITLQRNNLYNQELSEFNRIEKLYSAADTEERALKLGDQLEDQQEVTKRVDNQRIAFFSLTSLLYVFNLYDAFFDVPESGFQEKTDIEFYFQQNSISDQPFTSMTLKYVF